MARIGRHPYQRHDVIFGHIRSSKHSQYPYGLILSNNYIVRRTSQRAAFIKVSLPIDTKMTTEQFVLAAYDTYSEHALKETEQEHHLLFYEIL
ncbi:MAG: hypothetical protein IH934_04070 [Nanoarchaeota archaeon]|nr:hypothetical protein [Nanoarchaeota archaeon]